MLKRKQQTTKVLHVFGRMGRGGAETWAMNVLRNIDRSKFQFDFLVHSDQPGEYDEEILSLGGAIHLCPISNFLPNYLWRLRQVIENFGPYDVVHSHVHHFSGFTLLTARTAGVPVRIAHCHSDTLNNQMSSSLGRRVYLSIAEMLVAYSKTIGLAASENAARALFGPEWKNDHRNQVFYCGIDVDSFQVPEARTETRRSLGIPSDAFILGHVGRFIPVKNHRFVVEVAKQCIERNPNTYLLLVGEGDLRENIEARVVELGIRNRVIFAGARSDVPNLMINAMDAFLMPSLYEGLPLAGIEAQTAGLPSLFSEGVTPEVLIVPEIARRVSLDTDPGNWADTLLALAQIPRRNSLGRARSSIESGPFNVKNSIRTLERIYGN